MNDILIYSTRACPYCVVAKRALEARNIPYREVDITLTPEVRDELHARTGERTVPQIFINGDYIGQDDELVALVETGSLDPEPENITSTASQTANGPATYDVAIVGGGTSGWRLATRLGPVGDVVVLDRLPHVDGVDPELDQERKAALKEGVTWITQEVFSMEPAEAQIRLITVNNVVTARRVVIATGARERDDQLPGEAELRGRGVSRCAECDRAFFTDAPVVVVGTDERAAKATIVLAEVASEVTLIYGDAEPAISPATLATLDALANVTLRSRARIGSIDGTDQVTGVTLSCGDETEQLSVSGAFMYLNGTRPATGFVGQLLTLDNAQAVVAGQTGQTSLARCYSVGPVASALVTVSSVFDCLQRDRSQRATSPP